MYYFPVANLTLISPLTDEQAAARISQNLEPKKMRYDHWLINPEKTRIFEGVLFGSRFKMKRIENHSGLCNSTITGYVKQEVYNKSTISLKFTLVGLNAALLFMIMVILTMGGLAGIGTLFSESKYYDVALVCIALWIGVYALILWRFNAIVNKTVRDLSEILEAKPKEFTI